MKRRVSALLVPVRFQPAGFGPQPAMIAVTGSTNFGGVSAGCGADRTISVRNVGDCALRVTSVRLRRPSRYWRLLHDPAPAKLNPGSCLPVVLHYHATERCSRSCELVISSDDPETPEKVVEVSAYTIWDDCRCERYHCRQGYPCGCADDDEHR